MITISNILEDLSGINYHMWFLGESYRVLRPQPWCLHSRILDSPGLVSRDFPDNHRTTNAHAKFPRGRLGLSLALESTGYAGGGTP